MKNGLYMYLSLASLLLINKVDFPYISIPIFLYGAIYMLYKAKASHKKFPECTSLLVVLGISSMIIATIKVIDVYSFEKILHDYIYIRQYLGISIFALIIIMIIKYLFNKSWISVAILRLTTAFRSSREHKF